ncbi:hypothetical protein PG997_014462 [Apiospora hydei]|uniref:AA1-like domain-containing protein n=1 Tax=Apiospora hydei TaxID=1337664 RepID=A0ABR1UTV5_9PEZI
MYLLILISSLLLARPASGSPILDLTQATQPSTPNTTWTIIEHRIACTETQCLYNFDITKATPNQPQQDPTHCEFTVDTSGTGAAALPANRTSFQDKTCGSIYKNSYTVNGGFMNASGAVVLCFKNPRRATGPSSASTPGSSSPGPRRPRPHCLSARTKTSLPSVTGMMMPENFRGVP